MATLKTAIRYHPLCQEPPQEPIIESMTGGSKKAELAPMNIVAVMATPLRATNQAPMVLWVESWPAIIAPTLAMMPKQMKYAMGDETRKARASEAPSRATAPIAMVSLAPMRSIKAPITGADSPWKRTKREKPMPNRVPVSPIEASSSIRGLMTLAAGRITPDEQKYMNPNMPIRRFP